MDILLGCLFLVPFRCRVCRKRFYLLWQRGFEQAPAPDAPVTPVLIMPARRKVPKVDTISTRRVDVEPVPTPRCDAELIPTAPIASSPNETSVASLELPGETPEKLHTLPSQPALTVIPSPGVPTTASGAILILENDLSIRKLLHRLLERRGYFVAEIEQADDILRQLRNRRQDLLIADVPLTGEPSLRTLAALASDHPGLKILALSENSFASEGPDEKIPSRVFVLAKPFPLNSFVDCVDRLLERSGTSNPPQ